MNRARSPRRAGQQGFSLLELLIAATVFLIGGGGALLDFSWGPNGNGPRTRESTVKVPYDRLRIVTRRLHPSSVEDLNITVGDVR